MARPGSTDVASGGDDTVNSVVVQNDRDAAVPATLEIDLTTLPSVTSVVVTASGTTRVVPVDESSATVTLDLDLAPGVTTVTLEGSTDGGRTTLGQSAAVGFTSIAVLQPSVEALDLTP